MGLTFQQVKRAGRSAGQGNDEYDHYPHLAWYSLPDKQEDICAYRYFDEQGRRCTSWVIVASVLDNWHHGANCDCEYCALPASS